MHNHTIRYDTIEEFNEGCSLMYRKPNLFV